MELRERQWSFLCLLRGVTYVKPGAEVAFLVLDVAFQLTDILMFLMHVSV